MKKERNIKETLLETLVNGKKYLARLDEIRESSPDKLSPVSVTFPVEKIHKKELHLIVKEILDANQNGKIIRFVSEDGYLPPFEAGQYINLFVEIDGIRTSRPYSISSSPLERNFYEITVAKSIDGFVSNYLCTKISVGDKFSANGPAGNFHYNPVFHKNKSLFLAGGSGITPFLSMIRELSENNTSEKTNSFKNRDVVLLYGCRNKKASFYNEELSAYKEKFSNFKYHLVLSENEEGWTGETGFLNKDLIKKLVPDFKERTAYICGPEVMNEFCQKELSDLGLPVKQIRREMFGAKRNIQSEEGWPKNLSGDEVFNIKVWTSDTDEVKNIKAKSSETILTALEKNHIRINVCCRSGECSLCRIKLISGKVFMGQGMMRRYADIQYGYIHSCKAYPISDIEVKI